MAANLTFDPSPNPSIFIARIQRGFTILPEDLELVATEQRTRILERTARGVDVDGRRFAPYSTKGPYYYYPNGRLGKAKSDKALQRNVAAATRLHRKLNAGRGTPVGSVTAGGAIKFANYDEFKKSLGRGNVDLMGPRAPLMLQSLIVKRVGQDAALGIYEPGKAAIASGHQKGTRTLPQRRFLGVSAEDREKIIARLVELLRSRR